MKDKIKTAIINNISRLLIAGFVAICTWAVTPIQEIIKVPNQMESMQEEFKANQQQFINALKKQHKTDSVLLCQVEKLQLTDKIVNTEVGTLKSKLTAIQEEFPVLHKRFNDIEQAVANTRNHELAFEIPFKINTNE